VATSTIAAATDALVAIIRAASSVDDSAIFDGPPITDEPDDFICVGALPGDGGGEAISGVQTSETLGNARRSEVYAIQCYISCYKGDTDMSARRSHAFALFAEIESAIRSNGTLTNTVLFAEIGSTGVMQEQAPDGIVVTLSFSVAVQLSRI